jgi:hypothetical protein
MISVAFEKNISMAKKRGIAPFKVNGQPHIILQQLSCGTRSNVSFVSNPAQISLKHSSQLTNKTTLATIYLEGGYVTFFRRRIFFFRRHKNHIFLFSGEVPI